MSRYKEEDTCRCVGSPAGVLVLCVEDSVGFQRTDSRTPLGDRGQKTGEFDVTAGLAGTGAIARVVRRPTSLRNFRTTGARRGRFEDMRTYARHRCGEERGIPYEYENAGHSYVLLHRRLIFREHCL